MNPRKTARGAINTWAVKFALPDGSHEPYVSIVPRRPSKGNWHLVLGCNPTAHMLMGERQVELSDPTASEPPSFKDASDASFPSRAFGPDTGRYRAFMQALIDGLRLYECFRLGEVGHAATPLPAA